MGAPDYSRGRQIGLLRRCMTPLNWCNKRIAGLYWWRLLQNVECNEARAEAHLCYFLVRLSGLFRRHYPLSRQKRTVPVTTLRGRDIYRSRRRQEEFLERGGRKKRVELALIRPLVRANGALICRHSTVGKVMGSLRPRELTELISVLWRRKKLVLLMSLAMLLATLIVVRRIPNAYESSAKVAINLRNDPGGAPDMNQFAKLQQELTSRETFTTLIRRHNLYPNAKDEEEAFGMLQKALKIETKMRSYWPQAPEAIEIRIRHAEPKKAQAVVTDLVKMLEHGDELRKTEASAEAGLLASQIAEVEQRLQELAPERALE